MCYGNLHKKMFIQRYINPTVIGVADDVRYRGKDYQVLINYVKGETDAKGFTPKSNFTILIAPDGKKTVITDYRKLTVASKM